MRHIPIAEFKNHFSAMVAAAEAGEAFVITRHGREVARLTPPEHDVVARRRQAFADLAAMREDMRRRGVAVTTREEIREWINEGRP